MLIIFDLDGTLFQTKLYEVKAVQQLFEELSIEQIDDDVVTKNIGNKTNEFLLGILPEYIEPIDVYERFRELEQQQINENAVLFENVIETLEFLYYC